MYVCVVVVVTAVSLLLNSFSWKAGETSSRDRDFWHSAVGSMYYNLNSLINDKTLGKFSPVNKVKNYW